MIGHISPYWNANDIHNLDYVCPPDPTVGFNFTDAQDADRYRDMISASLHRGLPSCLDNKILFQEFDWLNAISFSVTKMLPGNILPIHSDKYSYYVKTNNIKDLHQVFRAIVFLEDHQLGHFLHVDGEQINNWHAGDYVLWRGCSKHIAGNFGHTNRYTLQITGYVNT